MSFILQMLGLDARTVRDPDDERWWGGTNPVSTSGVVVDPETALKASAVYACVALIAETIAMLPLITYRRLPNGDRERATNHPLYDLLHSRPNRDQTAFEFIEMLTGHAMLRGDGLARKVPGPRGPTDQLVPMHPDRVRVERGATGVLRYRVRNEQGVEEVLNQEDVFHLKGKSSDGIRGVSVLTYARDSVGLALATEAHGGLLFSQGTRLSGVLQTDQKLDDKVQKRLKATWAGTYAGLKNSHSVAVLEQGLKWQSLGMTSEDAQFLETRSFQVVDIARWFRVPPHMIGETTKATSWGTGIEQMSIGFVVYTLMSWLVRWQQAIQRDLVIAPASYFCEFLVDGLLRGDTESRYNAYNVGRAGGWLSVNEIRRMENLNSIPNGDVYLEPLNMKEAGAPLPGRGTQDAESGKQKAETATHQEGERDAYLQLMVRDAAARVVRKEIGALSKIAEQTGSAEGWMGEVVEFYEKHADFVRQVLRLSSGRVDHWVTQQGWRAYREGIEVFARDEQKHIEALVALVMEEQGG